MAGLRLHDAGGVCLHYRIDGPETGVPVVFSNALGTDFRIWDAVVARLPAGVRILRYDTRGHGLSGCPPPPYGMGALVHEVAHLMDALGFREALFVGLSLGGMIGQGLAAKRLDLVRALVLSNTCTKSATRDIWADRLALVDAQGVAALADATMTRWFSKAFRKTGRSRPWQHMFKRTPAAGLLGCGHAISGTDFMTTTASLRLPVLGIAGSEDAATPPDLVRETVDLVPGSRFHLLRGAGHLACVEAPEAYAAVLTDTLRAQGMVSDPLR